MGTDKDEPTQMANSSAKAQGNGGQEPALELMDCKDLSPDAGSGFPIVGIGASAGGLAAFEAFFFGMPADTDPGMAFVLVQHLAPDHKSILTDLVQRSTRMQVFEVQDGMTVRPNCTYIIPPGRDMAFLGGVLQLLEPSAPRGQRMPIDFFFRSLAQDQHERAIGVVLSGTGSDGTLGVRAIKGEGGMVMVQDPASTEYDGMPRSALATGLVDFELSPAEMPGQIMAYAAQALGKAYHPSDAPPPKTENAQKKIFILLRAQTGHDFSQYKPSSVQRRIERRMAIHQIESLDGYVKFLQQTPAEVEALFRDMLIGVTGFFRDPEAFMALKEHVLPKLFSGKTEASVLRVWSVGCSTGEEAYSLAILLAEQLEELRQSFRVQIFATDIDSQAIATARTGLYPASIAADIWPERLARYFSLESDGSLYRIRKDIRDMLVFSEQNVIKDPPFSKLDLISCRNMLIYMGPELQKKIIPLFHYALNPGGYLFLGSSETVGEFGNLFTPLDRKSKVYQRKEDPQHSVPYRSLPSMSGTEVSHPRTIREKADTKKTSLRETTEQALLQFAAPAAAMVNDQGDILYLHGRTGLFLEPAPGESGVNNIIKMAREGLRRDLAMALHKAAIGQAVVRCPKLRVRTNGDFTIVNLTVRSVPTGLSAQGPGSGSVQNSGPSLFLVVLEQAANLESEAVHSSVPASAEEETAIEAGDKAQAVIASLRQELQAKEEYIQTAHEELETANEELRSSYEEMQSINEELQSTNEELETSKEELQSINEELSTVNSELQTKVADLTQANNDMNNLLAGTEIATVFVDHSLRILRFTPAAIRIINLIQSDIGRPVGHIVSNLVGYDTLPEDTQAVLDTLVPKEVEVQTKAGVWYTMRILPYRTLENVIEGAVITFVDISKAKKAQEDAGSPVCRLVLSDITERKQAEEERERLQEHLKQAQKMESVGRLAGGVAHEFNNMLSVITGNAELAMGNLAQDDPLQEMLREILTAATRSSEVTRQLLSFARKQIISPQELDVNHAVEGMLKMLRRLLGMDVDLVWMPEDQLWPVKMDPTQLVQVLTNLCLNARDAVSEGGRITVMTKKVTVSQADCSHQPGLEPGDFVLLTVSDNGCGMDKETLSNVFEPFFTTKEMDKGTGLGLATVHGIVRQNNGLIQVESHPGQGSTFKIYLPRHRASTAPAVTTEEPSNSRAHRTQTILVVDDEPAVLKMIHIMLEHLGYNVLSAEAPREAFRVAKSFSGTIDLILTDVIMPEMNGGEMAKQLQSLYPHLPCLFMSGYSPRVITDEGMLGSDVHFIQKPFAMKDLAHKIGQVLGNDAPADNQFVQARSIS